MPKIIAFLSFVAFLAGTAPGSHLQRGMQLAYMAGQTDTNKATHWTPNQPWLVVSATDTTLGGIAACRSLVIRVDSTRSPERRLLCTRGDTLFRWDTLALIHRIIRPVGEGMIVVVPGANGSRSTYETRSKLEQVVNGAPFEVIQTIVTTRDSASRDVRRLKEFYAPSLATATSGVFEVPDPALPGGWRIQTQFKLARVSR